MCQRVRLVIVKQKPKKSPQARASINHRGHKHHHLQTVHHRVGLGIHLRGKSCNLSLFKLNIMLVTISDAPSTKLGTFFDA